MIKNKVASKKLITEQIDTPQTGHLLSADELTRVTAFYSLLINIDRKNKAKEKAQSKGVSQSNEEQRKQA